jgi:outer membrane protein OmpA-like peptidoglycan-associated protein
VQGAGALTIVLSGVALTRPAEAQERIAVRIEAGVGAGTRSTNDPQGGPSLSVLGVARFGYAISDSMALQLHVGSLNYFVDGGTNVNAFVAGGGFRVEPMIGTVGRIFVDGNLSFAYAADTAHFGVDLGLGFEFRLSEHVYLGPVVRYEQIGPPANADVTRQGFTGGLSLTLRWDPRPAVVPPPPAPPADTDHDGVLDPQDLCPTTPAGEHPDPARRGCPIGDADGDGVLDPQDQCVNEPAGEHPDPERAGCPDGDDDHDGVLNHADQCRTEPAGAHPDPARAGCPLRDRDGDTVLDDVDHCPDQPGAPNPDPNLNGCPGLVTISAGQIHISQQVFFNNNSDVILPRSFPVLQAVADALRASPQIHRVSVQGHTDDVGNDAANLTLSQRRSESVVHWLTEHQIEANRLEAHGFGETRPMTPLTPTMTPQARNAARAQNRRVEFVITDPAQ